MDHKNAYLDTLNGALALISEPLYSPNKPLDPKAEDLLFSEGLDPTNEHLVKMRLGMLKTRGGTLKIRLWALKMRLVNRNCAFQL